MRIEDYDLCWSANGLSNHVVKIACPHLVSFSFRAFANLFISFEGLNSLDLFHPEEYEIDEECCPAMCKLLEAIRNTKVLKLSGHLSELLCRTLYEPECFSTSFYNLKSLVLYVGNSGREMKSIINLLEYTPNLEALTLFFDQWEPTDRWEVADKAISCLTSHLKVVELLHVSGYETELDLVRFLLRNGHVLQKMNIGFGSEKSIEKRMVVTTEVMNFPRSSSNVALKFLEHTVGVGIFRNHYYGEKF